MAGFVLANGSMSSNESGDCPARSASSKRKAKPQSPQRKRDIRRTLVEADLVDCTVALPGQLHYSRQIPRCLWSMGENKAGAAPTRDRRKRTLFIDAGKLGTLIPSVRREPTDAESGKITSTCHL